MRTDRTRWEKNYSGKHKAYGIDVQAVLAADGTPLWTSPGRPGATHDLTALRATATLPVIADLTARGVVVLAD